MDGSVASPLERNRFQASHGFQSRAANEVNAQSELFEQLLSLNFTVQPPPKEKLEAEKAAPSTDDRPVRYDDDEDSSPVEEEQTADSTPVAAAPLVPVAPILDVKTEAVQEGKPSVDSPTDKVPCDELCDLPAYAPDSLKPAAALESTDADDSVAIETIAASEAVTIAQNADVTQAAENIAPDDTSLVRRPRSRKNDATEHESLQQNASTIEPSGQTKEKVKEASQHDQTQIDAQGTLDQTHLPVAENDASGDRRGDRREKWFERDTQADASNLESNMEVVHEQSVPPHLRDVQDRTAATIPVNEAALSPEAASQPAADITSLATVSAAPAISALPNATAPGALNASATSTAAKNDSSTTTAIESTNLGPTTPTRTVGTKASNADAKDGIDQPQVSQQERVRVIQRIARSFNRISAEGGTINLRLHPEHLGSVTVQVRMEGRSMAAKLTTETTAARDAIMADLPALRQRLADQGFDVTKFQVNVTENGADATFAQSDSQQSNGQPNSSQYGERSNGTQTDYRRIAALRSAQLALTQKPSTAMNAFSGAGIDLHA